MQESTVAKITLSLQRDLFQSCLMIKACSFDFMQRDFCQNEASFGSKDRLLYWCAEWVTHWMQRGFVWPLEPELACECHAVSSVCSDCVRSNNVWLIVCSADVCECTYYLVQDNLRPLSTTEADCLGCMHMHICMCVAASHALCLHFAICVCVRVCISLHGFRCQGKDTALTWRL